MKIQKHISLLFCVILCTTMLVSCSKDTNTLFIPYNISDEKAAEFNKYKLALPDGTTSDNILDMCTEISRSTIENSAVIYESILYSSDTLDQYLTDFEKYMENGICATNAGVYIDYYTNGGDRVILFYNNDGWQRTTYNDVQNECCYVLSKDENVVYFGFEN